MNTILPPTIQAGATLDRSVALADHQAPEWTLTVHLRGPAVINLAATPNGTAHKLAKSAADTTAFTPGVYHFVARVTRTADGYVDQVEEGQVEILRDLAAIAAATDLRSHAQRTLDAILAVIEKRATRDQERYRINDRELYRTPITDLLRLKTHYETLVKRERAKALGASLWRPAARVRL